MPIKGLTDRPAAFPELGSIRKGDRGGTNGAPRDLRYFRIEIDEAETKAHEIIQRVYGLEPTELNILFPFDGIERNFECWLEAYLAGSLIYRSDGERVLYEINPETGERLGVNGEPYQPHRPNPLGFYTNAKGRREPINARPVGRMKVIIPELARLAYLTVHTTSIHDVVNLTCQLEALYAIHGRLAGIPLKLRRRPVKISTPSGENGKRVRREKWMLSVEADPEWVAAKIAEMKRLALPEISAIAAPPAPVIVSADQDSSDDADDAPEEVLIVETIPAQVQEKPPAPNGQNAKPKRPLSPAILRQMIWRKAESSSKTRLTASPDQRGLVATLLDECFVGRDDSADCRRKAVHFLSRADSLSEVSDGVVLAILDWLHAAKDSGGRFAPDPMAVTEAHMMVAESMNLDRPLEQLVTPASPEEALDE